MQNRKGSGLLHEAVVNGQLDKVKALIAEGVDPCGEYSKENKVSFIFPVSMHGESYSSAIIDRSYVSDPIGKSY
jgi:hypothetical protein